MMEKHYSTYPYIYRHTDTEPESYEQDCVFNAGMRASYFRALAKAQHALFDPEKNRRRKK